MAAQSHRTPAKPIRVSDLSPEAIQLIQEYEIWLLAHRGFQRTTVDHKLGTARRIIGAIGLSPMPSDMERYIADIRQTGVAYGTVYCAIQGAEDFMAFLKMPVRFGRPKKPNRSMKDTLTETEIAVILHHSEDIRERAILAVLAYSGIRNSELCKLRISYVDISESCIHVLNGKGVQSYTAEITGECAKLLSEYIAERTVAGATSADLLFVTKRHGHELAQQDLRKIVRVAVKRAGIKKRVHPHLFRHSLAMNMLNRGASIMTIQKQLGHSWVQTTMEYLRGEYTRAKHEYSLMAPRYL